MLPVALLDRSQALGVLFFASVMVSALGLFLTPLFIARIPARYFAEEEAPLGQFASTHPGGAWILKCVRNLVGVGFLVLGVVLLFLPGQGLLTILAGAMLTDFKGKRALEMRLVGMASVQRALSWMREKAGSEPLVFPGQAGENEATGSESDRDLKT